MEKEPFISIIMPAYNCEKFIEQAIESVIDQTYQNWELIIINDASIDATKDIVLKISNAENRIRYFENGQNLGVSETRNKGVSFAQGEWVAFLDSDDIWKKDKLEKQITAIRFDNRIALCYTGAAFINEKGKAADHVLQIPERVVFHDLLKQNVISCSSVLVRKECLEKFKMPHGDLHEDFAVWLQILKDEGIAHGINEPLLVYRVYTGSKSGNKLHAAKMQWRTYEFVGLNGIQKIYYMFYYTYRNLKKYKKIHESI